MLILLTAACSEAPETTDPVADAPGALALTDASNYEYDLTLSVATATLGSAGAVDWSGLTHDLLGTPVDPTADVEEVNLVWLRDLTREEAAEQMANGELSQASLGVTARGVPMGDATRLSFSEFMLYGSDVDLAEYFVTDEGSWALSFWTTGNQNGMVMFVEPSDGAEEVRVTSDSAALDLSVDLDVLEPVVLGDADRVSWSGLTTNGRGAAWAARDAEELWIARFDDATPAAVADAFALAEQLADETWTLDVRGTIEADLGDAVGADGAAFPGVDDGATWLLGIRCTSCTSPMPGYLTILEP